LATLSALTCQAADNDPLLEVRNGKAVTTSKLLAKDNERAVLIDRVGGLHDLTLGSVTLKPTSGRLQSLPMTESRNTRGSLKSITPRGIAISRPAASH
jgi:hypothetical protein